MFEVKPMNVENTDSGAVADEGCKQPETELVGLLEEQLPQYTLRADSLYVYESQDWVQSPSYSPDDASSALSPVLAEETFKYMILSSDRVEQMTKTYNDIDMVTHLLAERDRDLELAARIGQSLLQRNHVLQERNDAIEDQLVQAFDQVHQLQHELSKKDELLRIVASASEESETDSSCSTPLRHTEPFSLAHSLSQLEALQGKLHDLEEENLALRSEACHLKTETITYEEKEQQLVSDCVKELRESNSQMVVMSEELSRKNEELVKHQEEIANLLSQIVDLQHRVKELVIEKEELKIHLQASKDAQRQLTAELHDLQDRNAECLGMLQESQEEIKELRSKSTPSSAMRRHQSYGLFPMDSLAAEIEGTMRRELSVEEDHKFDDQKNIQKRVFETVKSVSELVRAHSATVLPPMPIPGSNQSGLIMTAQPFLSGLRPSRDGKTEPPINGPRVGHKLGQPGTPGSSDLAAALYRLSLRRENYLSERQFFEDERERKLKAFGTEEGSGCSSPNGSVISTATNYTDLSISSSCFKTFLPEKLQIVKPIEGSLTLHHWQQLAQPHLATILDPRPGVVTKGFKPLPEDAVYRLSDLEEDEEEDLRDRGVADVQEEEEEEEEGEGGIMFQVQCSSTPEDKKAPPTPPSSLPPNLFLPKTQIFSVPPPSSAHNPGKCLSSTHSTYTFTTCRILHPSDLTQVTPSSMYAPVPVGENTPSSLRTGPSTPVTPCRLSLGENFPPRRPSITATPILAPCGLAKLLQERGISAQVYNVTQARADPTRSPPPVRPPPPSTPPNSPSHSPPSSPIPFETRPPAENFLASRPAEIFLQEVYGIKPGRGRPDLAQNKVNLVERLRRLGFVKVLKGEPEAGLRRQESAHFIATGGGSLLDGLRRNQSLPAMIGGLGPPVSSPLAHPTSLNLPIPPMASLKEVQSPDGKLPAAKTCRKTTEPLRTGQATPKP
ncbi:trafficking kinesin-binding protein 2 isoform X2 [Amia ocellicauda]|uniref:trafficking kinesin-binding protein 2 isoform X2 n=1 Tax=Amia ocellicauda TaxID=2972642 RepID=UPI0034640E05